MREGIFFFRAATRPGFFPPTTFFPNHYSIVTGPTPSHHGHHQPRVFSIALARRGFSATSGQCRPPVHEAPMVGRRAIWGHGPQQTSAAKSREFSYWWVGSEPEIGRLPARISSWKVLRSKTFRLKTGSTNCRLVPSSPRSTAARRQITFSTSRKTSRFGHKYRIHGPDFPGTDRRAIKVESTIASAPNP